MGDEADLLIAAMESGYSFVWFPKEKLVRQVDNMELMYTNLTAGTILQDCTRKQLEEIAAAYKIRPCRNLYRKIMQVFDP